MVRKALFKGRTVIIDTGNIIIECCSRGERLDLTSKGSMDSVNL